MEASNNLSWTTSEDAVTYRVFRKSDSASTWTQLADTTATSHMDMSAAYGRAYEYKVSAIDAAGNAAASAVVRSTRTITPPQNVTATTPSYGAVFTWTEPPGGDTADYRVYRSGTSADGSRNWELITCRSRTTSTDAAGNTVRSCTDYDGRQGVTYHYVMTRKNTAGLWSTGSQELTVTRPGDEIPPPNVTGLTAQSLEYGVRLDWDDSPTADLKEYWVYGDTPGYEPEYIGKVAAGTSDYIVGPMPADGEERTFIVVAVDIYGNSRTYQDEPDVGDWSQPVSKATVTELNLTPTVIPDETAPCDLYSWSNDTGPSYLQMDCADSVATEATGIHVYRWDRAEGRWVRLTDTPLPPTATRYTDTTAPAGTTNHYVVSVVAADGSEPFSNVDWTVTLPSGA